MRGARASATRERINRMRAQRANAERLRFQMEWRSSEQWREEREQTRSVCEFKWNGEAASAASNERIRNNRARCSGYWRRGGRVAGGHRGGGGGCEGRARVQVVVRQGPHRDGGGRGRRGHGERRRAR